MVDRPSDRRIHKKETPLLGGLGIFIALMISVLVHYFGIILLYRMHAEKLSPYIGRIFIHVPGMIKVGWSMLGIFVCGFIIFIVGLFDDKFGLPAKLKFYLEIAIAFCIVYFFDIKITLFVKNEVFSYVITIFWIVGITNSFNLLDNMDGLSAGVAMTSSIVLLIASLIAGQLFIGLFLVAFIGVLLGFLRYNFPPASIFMGDAGSLFIGFILSILTIMGTYYIKGSSTLYPVLMPVIILGLPIYDTMSVIVIRTKNRESIFKPDKNHFSHRLLRLGMTHRGTALFVYLVTFCVAINAILLPGLKQFGVLTTAVQTLCILSIISFLEYYGKQQADKKNNGK
jgi:UDP-GlcNAc:undecaprenyl-phosphate GlcNAc-1-phosphate transferase